MLTMKEVCKTYSTDTVRTHALKRFSLDVREGDFVAVTGPSGSGKTTFLNIAGLLESFDSGVYLLEGSDVATLSDRALSRLRNEKIGFIFQSFNLIPDLNVFDNVDVPLRYRGFSSAERRERIEAALERVGLAGRAKHLPAQLSGGQQQRVGIARALAGEPRFLLADEPTGNLDSHMARGVLDLLEEINDAGTTIIMVTHDAALAQRAKREVRLLDGTLSEERGARGREAHGLEADGLEARRLEADGLEARRLEARVLEEHGLGAEAKTRAEAGNLHRETAAGTQARSGAWSFSEAPPGFKAPTSAEE